MFDRFLDWQVCRIALENPSLEVSDYAIQCLREMAQEGDPFSQALLADRKIPYSTSPNRSPSPSHDQMALPSACRQ